MFNGSLKLLSSFNGYPIAQKGALCQLCDVMDFFFVAHPESGRKEGSEHKRVFYFYTHANAPPDVSKQTEVTGFAEAVVNFTDNFSSRTQAAVEEDEFPFRHVTTQKTVQVYIQVECTQYLVGLSLEKKACKDMEYTIFTPTLRSVIIDAYKMFKLFFGTFAELHVKNEEKFRERLDYFFSRYLAQLRLFQMPLLNHFAGVDFQPMQGSVYLNMDTLLSETQEAFPIVEKVLFLYQDKLLYYSVHKRDLPSIYKYLTENLLPMSLRAELEPATANRTTSSGGKFLTGPADLNSDGPLGKDGSLPTVHLSSNDGTTLKEFQLMVYRSLNATVCLFCSGTVTRQLMRNIDGFLGSELSRLASHIGDAWVFVPSVSTQVGELRVSDFHFVYFNPSSLSLRTSFHHSPMVGTAVGGQAQPPTVPAQVHKVACDAYEKLLCSKDDFGECFVRDSTDWWIILKKVNDRILLLLLPPSSSLSTLPEAQVRAHEIIKSRFQGIFLL